MSDVIEGSITPSIANAAVNAGGKLLKVTELTLKYGKSDGAGSRNLPMFGEAGVQGALADNPSKELAELEALEAQIRERKLQLRKVS